MTILPVRPLHNPLDHELTTGFYAANGIPREFIVNVGKLAIADELVAAKLAKWDDDPEYGAVLKAEPALWDQMQALAQITAC